MTKKHPLWLLALSPVVWSLHFTASYIIAAIWCAKFPATDLKTVKILIGGLTFISLVIVGQGIMSGYKKHRSGFSEPPHDSDTTQDRDRFLGLTRLLISSLSFIAIIYNAYAVFIFGSCE